MVDVFDETQADRDKELAKYWGCSVQEVMALSIKDPKGIQIYLDDDLEADSYDHLYQSYKYLNTLHYLRVLSAYTVTRRAKCIRRIEKILGSLQGKDVLDFGCGVGSHGIYCAQHGAQVDLLDVDGPLFDYAKWRCKQRGLSMGIRGTRSKLGFGVYDIVLCLDVLEHVAHPIDELIRITRSLKPKGLLALEVSTMIKPTSGHFSTSIKEWKREGQAYLESYYHQVGKKVYEKK